MKSIIIILSFFHICCYGQFGDSALVLEITSAFEERVGKLPKAYSAVIGYDGNYSGIDIVNERNRFFHKRENCKVKFYLLLFDDIPIKNDFTSLHKFFIGDDTCWNKLPTTFIVARFDGQYSILTKKNSTYKKDISRIWDLEMEFLLKKYSIKDDSLAQIALTESDLYEGRLLNSDLRNDMSCILTMFFYSDYKVYVGNLTKNGDRLHALAIMGSEVIFRGYSLNISFERAGNYRVSRERRFEAPHVKRCK